MRRQFIYLLLMVSLASCVSKKKGDRKFYTEGIEPNVILKDSILTFKYKLDIKDTNIVNTTNRKIDVLFNGIDDFLKGPKDSGVNFDTECMMCEPIQEFRNGLLFAKRLLITPREIKFYKSDFNISDTAGRIDTKSYYGEKRKVQFNFGEGEGLIKYIGQSCYDADFNNVKFFFDNGEINIQNIINATFFEYDLDKNGEKEQYVFGIRNCTQEIVLLRITK
ncbi:hypothetical protein ACQ33O_02880 [Ferruginibacter sp. SUN002]|uniref:hypothetical protein n=1 Tax=Ferruginibacter sp. SUN002 TaxID=2937789 RepID=UPI003D36CBD2